MHQGPWVWTWDARGSVRTGVGVGEMVSKQSLAVLPSPGSRWIDVNSSQRDDTVQILLFFLFGNSYADKKTRALHRSCSHRTDVGFTLSYPHDLGHTRLKRSSSDKRPSLVGRTHPSLGLFHLRLIPPGLLLLGVCRGGCLAFSF